MLTSAEALAKQVHQALLSPDTYPENPRQVELKETHISWVYLTSHFAYKQKKAVKFDFLDFSTLELRKRDCEHELALNRRFSPEVYHSIVPVTRDYSGRPRLNGSGAPIEWLVKMKRLDDRLTLESIIRRQELTDVQVKRLAESLGNFYVNQAPAVVRTLQFRQALSDHIAANRGDLSSRLPGARAQIGFATGSQLRFLHLHAELFDRRVCDGCVVDGHGDLRPEHIYLGSTKPHIIDCIEFNAEYRQNDIIDELAFLAMECDLLGAPRIGQAVIAEYIEASRDRPPKSLISFYKSYRACVRAKVATLRCEQQTADTVRSQREADDYLQWAAEYAHHLGPQLVIIFGGLMGSGKSTLATALQGPLAATLLRTDIIRSEFFDRNGDTAFGEGKYSTASRNQVYDNLIDRLGKTLANTPTVLLDGTFAAQAHRVRACRAARDLGATVLQVQCVCPEDVAIRRISDRTASKAFGSEGRSDIYHQQAAAYESPLPGELLVQVDTTQSISEQVAQVVARLREIMRL